MRMAEPKKNYEACMRHANSRRVSRTSLTPHVVIKLRLSPSFLHFLVAPLSFSPRTGRFPEPSPTRFSPPSSTCCKPLKRSQRPSTRQLSAMPFIYRPRSRCPPALLALFVAVAAIAVVFLAAVAAAMPATTAPRTVFKRPPAAAARRVVKVVRAASPPALTTRRTVKTVPHTVPKLAQPRRVVKVVHVAPSSAKSATRPVAKAAAVAAPRRIVQAPQVPSAKPAVRPMVEAAVRSSAARAGFASYFDPSQVGTAALPGTSACPASTASPESAATLPAVAVSSMDASAAAPCGSCLRACYTGANRTFVCRTYRVAYICAQCRQSNLNVVQAGFPNSVTAIGGVAEAKWYPVACDAAATTTKVMGPPATSAAVRAARETTR
ncbi:hypothetical protein AMAG_04400 [Allomyces macrogynus ATCC 38327]|uniref:Uncharacterized protein n=1 Tax=Allomyces macrogynus (strain ATCC 38327) TaxID=578462 RepID=A0A0L0S8Q7_ALLM3|nr:hypothetical protein AMAG_04400 [Allomyces macrogynus ATCC 38327]|eukprot:KNE58862.1 hypothetical protein AMAG_04400 [Allomyces macrogynus ATCC 38327]